MLRGMASRPPDHTAGQPAKGAAIALAIAAGCAICLPLTTSSEGVRVKPYWDPAHIRTVCFGETQDIEERIYEKSECGEMLRKRLAHDYAPAILKCVPGFVRRERWQAFGAAVDGSYNAGPGGFCRSPMARLFNSGYWVSGCRAFVGWRVTARVHGVPTRMPGLVTRRYNEMVMCLKVVAT
jgi:lysozyme